MATLTGQSELEKAMRLRPGAAPDVLIEDLAEQLSILGEVEPPVDLRLLASLQSIDDVRETVSSHSGCLINEGGRLRIELCAMDSPERQSFTIGHEICHTLLPGFMMKQNFRCTPLRATPRRDGTLNIEWLADVGASELLLPRRFVGPTFASHPYGWDTIEQVKSDYGASLEATARRAVRLTPQPAFFVRLEFATSRQNAAPALRVKSAACSSALDVFIPPNKSIPRDHPIFRASEGEYVDELADMRSLRLPGKFLVSARPYPYNNDEGDTVMRVLVLGIKAPTARSVRL
ncbi:ImmA/IrrE family metallo-endopeptidase [Nocardioides sp. SYSU D00038]|uniref:ImmA/IrrE family metallo-endopeptidase n=1 Tax=Nocardioides sp. SYSU D00038 TaxID=2812554 RepID=UPI001967CDE4|nr:ImmA/IrrE family metallo-endopeptidase [Nocardioides sp. SYSU D00038]